MARVFQKNFVTRPRQNHEEAICGEAGSRHKRRERVDRISAGTINDHRSHRGECFQLESKDVDWKVQFQTGAPNVLQRYGFIGLDQILKRSYYVIAF